MHPLELLSDWVIFTPAGRIDPRQTRTLRVVREHLPELRQAMNASPDGVDGVPASPPT